jgi:hypothetical protein
VDSGADNSLVKSKRLMGTVDFERKDRGRVKIIDGSIYETRGSTESRITTDELDISFRFHLLSRQVELKETG